MQLSLRVNRAETGLRLFSKKEQKLLQRSALGRICTIDRHGYPHCVQVDYAYDKDQIFIGSQAPRKWHRNISKNSRVAFEIDMYERRKDGVFDFRGLMVKGEASLVKTTES